MSMATLHTRYEQLLDYIILLESAMYGLVQSPREFFMLYCVELKKIGMVQSVADPCVWYKVKKEVTVLIVVVYVDDCILAGPIEEIIRFKKEIKKRTNITEQGPSGSRMQLESTTNYVWMTLRQN